MKIDALYRVPCGLMLSLAAILAVSICAHGDIFCTTPSILDFGDDAAVTTLPFTIRNCSSVTSDFTVTTGYVPGQDTAFIVDIDPVTAIYALPPGGEETLTVEITRSGFASGGPYKNYIKVYTDSYTDCEYGCLYEVRMSVPYGCTWKNMIPEDRHFEYGGGMGNVEVTTDSGCPPWTPEPQDSWISIIMYNEGTGVFSYLVDPNSGEWRTGSIIAAGLSHTVTQDGGPPCTYSVSASPSGLDFSHTGGTGNIDVTTQDECLWEATTSASWIEFITQTYWTGSGTVTFVVASNTGEARSGTVTVAGQPLEVTQQPWDPCNNDTTPPNVSISVIPGACECIQGEAPDCSVELRWSSQDNCSSQAETSFRHRLDNGNWSQWLPGEWNYAYSGLPDGQHTFDLEARDAAGNVGSSDVSFALVCSPKLCISTDFLDFVSGVDSLSFEVWNCGSGLISYTISESEAWLEIIPESGSSSGAPNTVRVEVDRGIIGSRSVEATFRVIPSVGTEEVVRVLVRGAHYVPRPGQPSGPETGATGKWLTYRVDGVTCNRGHSVKYEFDWGDGSGLPWGASLERSHQFVDEGVFEVRVRARCQEDHLVVSNWSSPLIVTIDGDDPQLCKSIPSLNYGSGMDSQSFEVWNCGSGNLTYTMQADQTWIDISPASESSTGEHDTIEVTIDRTKISSLPASGSVTIDPSHGSSQTVTVSVVNGAGPQLCKSTTSLSYGSDTGSQSFEVWNCGSGNLTYTMQADQTWIDISPASESSTGEHDSIVVTIDRTKISSLPASGSVTIDPSHGSSQTVTVSVVNGAGPQLCKSTTSLSYGSDTDSQSFEVWNCGGGTLTYTVQADQTWIDISPVSGSSTGEHDSIVVTINRSGIASLPASGTVTVDPDPGSNQILTVSVMGAFVDVGPLRVYANSFTAGDMTSITASGNVSINELLYFSGDLQIDTNSTLISGSGSVWLEGIPVLGTVPLYEAESFTIDAEEAMLSAKQGLESALSVGSLEFRLTGFEFVADGVIVGGHLTLPPNVGGIVVDAEVSITTSGGLELLGGELSIRELWVGAFKLADVLISYSQEEDYVYGKATLGIPGLFDTSAKSLTGQIAFRRGMLDRIGVGLGVPNTPIDGLPVFLQYIHGEVGGLVQRPVYVDGGAVFTGGPMVAGLYAVKADIHIYIDETGYLTGDGELFVLTDDVSIAQGHVELSTEGVKLEGAFDILGILQAELDARLTPDNKLYGYFMGRMSTPDDWPFPFNGHHFIEIGIYLTDDAIATELWLPLGAVLSVVYQPGADCSLAHWGDFWFFCDLTPYKSVGPMAISTAGVDAHELVSIPAGEEFVIFRVEGAQGTPRVYLVNPQGEQIRPEVAQSDPNTYYYGVNPVTHDGGYIVSHPSGGVWEVVIENPAEIGSYTVQVMGGNANPTIEVTKPSEETDESSVLIKWEAADPDDNASISLFYDTDTKGANGILIKSGLGEDSGGLGQHTWDTTGIPEGRYYIYAVIDDDHGVPGVAYAPGAVVVGERDDDEDDEIEVTVLNAPNPVVEGYTTFLATAGSQEVQALKVTVYDPAGRLLWHSETGGGMLGWDTTDTAGRLLGNGVYYYIAVVKVDGQWSYVPPGKLVIVR